MEEEEEEEGLRVARTVPAGPAKVPEEEEAPPRPPALGRGLLRRTRVPSLHPTASCLPKPSGETPSAVMGLPP